MSNQGPPSEDERLDGPGKHESARRVSGVTHDETRRRMQRTHPSAWRHRRLRYLIVGFDRDAHPDRSRTWCRKFSFFVCLFFLIFLVIGHLRLIAGR